MTKPRSPRRIVSPDVDIDVDIDVDADVDDPAAGLGGDQLAFEWDAPPRASYLRLMSVEEIYDNVNQALLGDLREDSRFERKPPGVQGRLLGEYFSTYANTEPDGGLIAIGIEDNGSISGLNQFEQPRINDLEKAGHIYCPEAKFKIKRVSVTNKKGNADFILMARVFYDPQRVVEDVEGNAYIRISDTKKKLTETEKHELKISKGQIDFEQEGIQLSFPSDFDIQLLNQYVETVRRERRLSISLRAEEILQLRRLGKSKAGKFIPNIACALLFAKDPQIIVPGCKLRFLRYDGDEERTGERLNVVKDMTIEGPVPILVREAENILNAQLREFTHLGPHNKFYSAPEYSKDACYEAIVNACVHRSYSLRTMHVFVKMFDNRLLIESPGGFMAFVTPENIYEMHEPRNPHLMDAMFYMNFVHCGHEGTRRMRDSMQRMSLPAPEFSQKQVGAALVRVTLRNNISHRRLFVDTDAFKVVGEELAQQLDADERRIVNFIAEHGRINVAQAMKVTGVRWHTIEAKMMRLAEMGVLRHVHKTDVERDRMAHFVLLRQANGEARGDGKSTDKTVTRKQRP